MKSNTYSIVSLESGILGDIYDDTEKEAEEKLLARRRCIKLFCIPLVFIISFGFLTFSVVHDVQARARCDQHLQKIVCQENDLDCLALICPVGMEWDEEAGRCQELIGYTCCPTCSQEYSCFKPEESSDTKCCHLLGILPSSYKLVCREGWVWVEWQHRCLQVNDHRPQD
jgi:hypothetical protein